MTLGSFLRTFFLTTFVVFFGVLGLLYWAAERKGYNRRKAPVYEPVPAAELERRGAERRAQEEAAWGKGPPGTWADHARKARKPAPRNGNAERAARESRCFGATCIHDVRETEPGIVPPLSRTWRE